MLLQWAINLDNCRFFSSVGVNNGKELILLTFLMPVNLIGSIYSSILNDKMQSLFHFCCIKLLLLLRVMFLTISLCVYRLRDGGMVSPQPVTTLGRRWRPGREGRGSAWAGRVPGRWSSIRTPRVSVSHYATSSFILQNPLCTLTSRWESQMSAGPWKTRKCLKC